jgi:hypothetical protein
MDPTRTLGGYAYKTDPTGDLLRKLLAAGRDIKCEA